MLTLDGWKYFKGCVLGVRAPAWRVTLVLPTPAAPAVADVRAAVAHFTGETPVARDLRPADWRAQCARDLAWAAAAMQRGVNCFVPDDVWVQPLQGDAVALTLAAPEAARAKLALSRLVHGVNALMAPQRSTPPAPTTRLEPLLTALARELAVGVDGRVNVYMLRQAAHVTGLPVLRCNPRFEVIGCGRRARVFDSTITDVTPSLGVMMAKNKQATASVLRMAGLPGTQNQRVTSVEQAWAAAEALGWPVVVKPNDRDRGEGVFADLRTRQEVADAYAQASARSRQILVEKWVAGYTHRLSVFEDEVVHVSKRIAGGVTGDGVHSVAELLTMRQQSADARRQRVRRGVEALTLDVEAMGLLAREGLHADSVLPPGRYVRLRRRDNINAGGTNVRCDLAAVHPDNLRLAVDAARLLRLDFAGVDLLIEDIGRSWLTTGGVICEINAQPQLRAGGDQDLYALLFQRLFAQGGRVPMNALVTPDAQARDPAVAGGLAAERPRTLVSAASGLWRDGERLSPAFADGHAAAVAALLRTDAEQVLCVLGIAELLHNGLPTFAWDGLSYRGFESAAAQWEEPLRAARDLVAPFFSTADQAI